MRFRLEEGVWLGIDVGSNRDKVCSFCLIESDGAGRVHVSFEKGPARTPYPKTNTREALFGTSPRPPRFFAPEIEKAVEAVLDESALVRRWLVDTRSRRAVAVDAPVGFAVEGQEERLTETACTQSFKTPPLATFEIRVRERKLEYHRINTFWKCVGFTVYRHLGRRMALPDVDADDGEALAAATVAPVSSGSRLRETFPSDIYKRANGRVGTLKPSARKVLAALVAKSAMWQGVGAHPPAPVTLNRLFDIRDGLQEVVLTPSVTRLCEMSKRGGTAGDLWDAFTCAFAACCEDHDASHLHGKSDDPAEQARLSREGAILTVASILR